MDGGRTWDPTIDINSDVHEVRAHQVNPDIGVTAHYKLSDRYREADFASLRDGEVCLTSRPYCLGEQLIPDATSHLFDDLRICTEPG
jgi:hypothetical protein